VPLVLVPIVDVVAVELDELGIDGLDGAVETVGEVVVMADGVLLGGVVTTGVVLASILHADLGFGLPLVRDVVVARFRCAGLVRLPAVASGGRRFHWPGGSFGLGMSVGGVR
jgi:hypothetical protein